MHQWAQLDARQSFFGYRQHHGLGGLWLADPYPDSKLAMLLLAHHVNLTADKVKETDRRQTRARQGGRAGYDACMVVTVMHACWMCVLGGVTDCSLGGVRASCWAWA